MGQKVNPYGFRLGVTTDWKSRWFADRVEYADFIIEDWKIRDYLMGELRDELRLAVAQLLGLVVAERHGHQRSSSEGEHDGDDGADHDDSSRRRRRRRRPPRGREFGLLGRWLGRLVGHRYLRGRITLPAASEVPTAPLVGKVWRRPSAGRSSLIGGSGLQAVAPARRPVTYGSRAR
jgi:hypothetical protein